MRGPGDGRHKAPSAARVGGGVAEDGLVSNFTMWLCGFGGGPHEVLSEAGGRSVSSFMSATLVLGTDVAVPSRCFFVTRRGGSGIAAGAPSQSTSLRATGLETGGRPAAEPAGNQPKEQTGDHPNNLRATGSRTGGRPARELAGDWPLHWRATSPKIGGRAAPELAGDQPKTWRATSPRTGGRPAQDLAGDRPENWRATTARIGGRPAQGLAGDQPAD